MQNETNHNALSRRNFLVVSGGLGGLIAVTGGSCFGISLFPSGSADNLIEENESGITSLEIPGEFGDTFTVGSPDRFANGTVTDVPAGRFYLVRLENGGFLALYNVCTHLGCTAGWDAEASLFKCPCHDSEFDTTGAVVRRPARRPLDRFSIELVNGEIQVNTATRIRREAFSEEDVFFVQ